MEGGWDWFSCNPALLHTHRNRPRNVLQSEISSLKDIIEQYKRSVKSLDDEIELHKLNQREHNKRINQEKQ